MSDDYRIKIALACGFILFVYIFIFVFLKGNTKANKLKEKAIKNGCVVDGIDIKCDRRQYTGKDGRYRSAIVSYEYYVNGKRYVRKITFSDNSIYVVTPKSVQIFYDKKNPRRAYADVELGFEQQKQYGCYAAIVIPVIVVIFVYNILRLI